MLLKMGRGLIFLGFLVTAKSKVTGFQITLSIPPWQEHKVNCKCANPVLREGAKTNLGGVCVIFTYFRGRAL